MNRPTIVCLCGSTRFYDEFQQANFEHTMAGMIVLTVGFYPHNPGVHGEGVGITTDDKVALDLLHKQKIDMADYVYVINKDGYVGESTTSEINHAATQGKPIYFLEPTCWMLPDGVCASWSCDLHTVDERLPAMYYERQSTFSSLLHWLAVERREYQVTKWDYGQQDLEHARQGAGEASWLWQRGVENYVGRARLFPVESPLYTQALMKLAATVLHMLEQLLVTDETVLPEPGHPSGEVVPW